jgi:hypothetical protein
MKKRRCLALALIVVGALLAVGLAGCDSGTSIDPNNIDQDNTDSRKTEPGKTEPGKTEPGTTEPGTTEPGKTEPGKPEPGKTEPGKTEPGKTEPGKTDPGKTEPGTTEPGKILYVKDLDSYFGYKTIGLFPQGTSKKDAIAQKNLVADCNPYINNGTGTPLYQKDGTAWKGTGTFDVFIYVYHTEESMKKGSPEEVFVKRGVAMTNVKTDIPMNSFQSISGD